ncbi:hypothetical protein F2Q69_00052626 [Brassica cretica]|uniref:Uncharacterized protein n=1 Tax=Brassica cretica TaxID=69181 RepID=A0A8S9N0Y6_BRACR|nr:hypothetical protein F2Q69_00052626 [Brassica cretica]
MIRNRTWFLDLFCILEYVDVCLVHIDVCGCEDSSSGNLCSETVMIYDKRSRILYWWRGFLVLLEYCGWGWGWLNLGLSGFQAKQESILISGYLSLQFHGNLMFNKNRQGGDRWDFVIKDGPIFWKGGFHKASAINKQMVDVRMTDKGRVEKLKPPSSYKSGGRSGIPLGVQSKKAEFLCRGSPKIRKSSSRDLSHSERQRSGISRGSRAVGEIPSSSNPKTAKPN